LNIEKPKKINWVREVFEKYSCKGPSPFACPAVEGY
jgi:hypothetical protein